MIDVKIEVDTSQLDSRFQDFEKQIPRLHNTVLKKIANRVVKNWRTYYLPGKLRRRTGTLRSSGYYKSKGMFAVDIFPRAWYAAVLEKGAVQTPQHHKYLAVPLAPEARGNGMTNMSPRNIPGLFPLRAKSGELYLARRPFFLGRGKQEANYGSHFVLMYALRKSVTIPARPTLGPAFNFTLAQEAPDIAAAATQDFIKEHWEQV